MHYFFFLLFMGSSIVPDSLSIMIQLKWSVFGKISKTRTTSMTEHFSWDRKQKVNSSSWNCPKMKSLCMEDTLLLYYDYVLERDEKTHGFKKHSWRVVNCSKRFHGNLTFTKRTLKKLPYFPNLIFVWVVGLTLQVHACS